MVQYSDRGSDDASCVHLIFLCRRQPLRTTRKYRYLLCPSSIVSSSYNYCKYRVWVLGCPLSLSPPVYVVFIRTVLVRTLQQGNWIGIGGTRKSYSISRPSASIYCTRQWYYRVTSFFIVSLTEGPTLPWSHVRSMIDASKARLARNGFLRVCRIIGVARRENIYCFI